MKKRNLNYIYNLCYQILIVIIPVFLTPYLSRTLGVKCIGIYGYVNSIISIIVTIGLLGINTYGYREIAFCSDDVKKRSKLFFEITLLRFILMILAFFAYMPFLFSNYSIYFLILIFHFVSQFMDFTWLFIGVENLKIVAIRNFLVKLISTVLIFMFVKSPEDLDVYLWILSLSSVIVSCSIVFNLKKYVDFSIAKEKIKIKKLVIHLYNSLKLFFPQIGLILFLQVDKIMLKIFCGEVYVAYYEYAEKIISIPLAMLTAMCTAYVPYMSKLLYNNENDELNKTVNSLLDFSLLLAIPMCFGIMAISSNFISWYLDVSFAPVVNTLYFLCPTILFNACINVLGNQYLTVKNNVKVLTISYFGALVIDIILNAIFIKNMKDQGAALATCFGLLFAFVYQLAVVHKEVKLNDFFEKVKYLISGICMMISVLILSNFFPKNIIGTLGLIFIGCIIYFISLIILKPKNIILCLKKICKK